jgi:hypothetical protein
MNDSEDWSSGLNATPRRPKDSRYLHLPEMAGPDGTASIEQPEYGPEEVHSVLTPAGEIESDGRFYRGLGPRRTKVVVFGTLSFILIVGILNELR